MPISLSLLCVCLFALITHWHSHMCVLWHKFMQYLCSHHTGEYRPDHNACIVKKIDDKAAIGRGDTFGSTVPRSVVCVWLCVYA